MRLALAIVSLAFVLVTLAAATFDIELGGAKAPSSGPSEVQALPSGPKNTVWISGQQGCRGDVWGAGFAEQARIAFQNLEFELERVGGSLDDVVELTTYHRDLGSLEEFRAIRAEVFGAHQPAWTAVEVADLVRPESLVEIKATAVIRARP